MEEQGDVVSFGPFRLYRAQRKLLCRGVEVRLGGRAMDVLRVLAKKKAPSCIRTSFSLRLGRTCLFMRAI